MMNGPGFRRLGQRPVTDIAVARARKHPLPPDRLEKIPLPTWRSRVEAVVAAAAVVGVVGMVLTFSKQREYERLQAVFCLPTPIHYFEIDGTPLQVSGDKLMLGSQPFAIRAAPGVGATITDTNGRYWNTSIAFPFATIDGLSIQWIGSGSIPVPSERAAQCAAPFVDR